jgi:hypothetical protein
MPSIDGLEEKRMNIKRTANIALYVKNLLKAMNLSFDEIGGEVYGQLQDPFGMTFNPWQIEE